MHLPDHYLIKLMYSTCMFLPSCLPHYLWLPTPASGYNDKHTTQPKWHITCFFGSCAPCIKQDMLHWLLINCLLTCVFSDQIPIQGWLLVNYVNLKSLFRKLESHRNCHAEAGIEWNSGLCVKNTFLSLHFIEFGMPWSDRQSYMCQYPLLVHLKTRFAGSLILDLGAPWLINKLP